MTARSVAASPHHCFSSADRRPSGLKSGQKYSFLLFIVPCSHRHGTPRKTLGECVKKDTVDCNLSFFDPLERNAWREAGRIRQEVTILSGHNATGPINH